MTMHGKGSMKFNEVQHLSLMKLSYNFCDNSCTMYLDWHAFPLHAWYCCLVYNWYVNMRDINT